MGNEIVKAEPIQAPVEWTETDIKAQVQKIQRVMKSVMKEGEHFGVIPGCKKPSLLKPGAEKLGLMFRLAPRYRVINRDLGNDHREVEVICELTHITTGQFIGEGVGSCNTKEAKYRYREPKRTCPKCGAEAIIKGKEEYGGGWVCWKKKEGCGASFSDNDPEITEQSIERVENPDIADCYNTILKMGKKRAQVDAILTATAASDIFTQDIEDMDFGKGKKEEPSEEKREPMPSKGKGNKQAEPKATQPQVVKLFTMLRKLEATEDQEKDFVYFCAGRSSTADVTRTEVQEMYRILDGLTEPFMLRDWLQHAEESYAIDNT